MEASAFHSVYTKREAELPFYITSIGKTPEEYRIYRPVGIDSYQILYSVKGCGRAKLYDEWVSVPEKSLMITPPNTPHFYEMQGEVWETYWITFSGWGTEHFFDVDAMVIPVPDEVSFPDKFNKILSLESNQQWNLQSSAYLYSLLLDCKELIPEEESASAYKLRKKLKSCLKYIHNNYMNEIELSHLADISGISREHLCRIFRQYTGMRPFEYITKTRIQKAKELLIVNSDMSITDIAHMSGFQSSSYFASVFRKHTNMTPEQFRKKD